jgi:hypothetical protein
MRPDPIPITDIAAELASLLSLVRAYFSPLDTVEMVSAVEPVNAKAVFTGGVYVINVNVV